MSTAAPTTRQHATLIGSMGCNQILAWGSTFYLPAVLAEPVSHSLNTSVPAGGRLIVVSACRWNMRACSRQDY
jgi:hypothetical protein